MNRLIYFLLLASIENDAFAANDVVNSTVNNTLNQTTIITSNDIYQTWDLTSFEWNQYLKLMQGPSGHYYSQLTPPEILGITAENNQDRKHFAEISAKLEHDKLQRELLFNNAFHQAAAKIYATEPLIKQFDYARFTPIK